MPYVLEGPNENERLERQARQENYDFAEELEGIDFPSGDAILDAGCGSGVVSRYLAQVYPGAKVVGCDSSQERLALAQNADAGLRNLEFVPGDICQLPFESHALDAVVCRFVLHHLGAAAPKALSEMVRVLKPGGLICVIDVDGLLLKLHPQTPRVATVLDRLKAQAGVDLQMGRKIPGILATLSVENLRWEVMPYRSSEAGMQQEASLMEERFRAAAPLLAEVCGSPDEAQHFVAEYLQTLRSPGSVYFHSKFRITGTAPVSAGGSVAR